VAGDVHHVGVRLRDAGRDGTDSGLGDQLHVDIGVGTRSLQIEDELLEVLDRVDVVLWRRRDEPDTGWEHRTCAIISLTFLPGRWPPSPGFDPVPS